MEQSDSKRGPVLVEYNFRTVESNFLREKAQRLGGPFESDLVLRTSLRGPCDQSTLPRGICQALGYTKRVRGKTTGESSISGHASATVERSA